MTPITMDEADEIEQDDEPETEAVEEGDAAKRRMMIPVPEDKASEIVELSERLGVPQAKIKRWVGEAIWSGVSIKKIVRERLNKSLFDDLGES